MHITGGHAGSGGGIVNGNVFNSSTVSLTGCTVAGNTADVGGGIANFGPLTLTNCAITGNTAGTTGGGIFNNGGTVTLDAASHVTGNAADPNDPDSGGGIYKFGGTVTLSSTENVTGNTPDNCGSVATPIPLCVD
jgi:hypothetical protein